MNGKPIALSAAILSAASVVGGKEKNGPLGDLFDLHDPDDRFGQKTWEGAESEMQRRALRIALSKGMLEEAEIEALFAGDLLNQCVGSAYGLLEFDIPYFGLYGACSTCAEGLMLAAISVTGKAFERAASVTSSHYCAAERQYRSPIEYGAQRTPTAQWTVTGSGAFIVAHEESSPENAARLVRALPGRVIDAGINDAGNMGAAMAPAALDTLCRFFRETRKTPDEFDLIVTGDLGFEGGEILCELMGGQGLNIRERYTDCGMLIYDRVRQDVHGGGSGCGCSAVVLASHLLPRLERGELERILFLSTGAMMSPDSLKQGQNIPAVAHLLELRSAPQKR